MKTVQIAVTAVIVVAALVGGVFLGWKGMGGLFPSAGIETVTESRSTQIIQSVNREEQIVLLSLGIQGVEMIDSHGKVGDWVIPGSDMKALLPYSFLAKVGIEGREVKISQLGENHFLISIPEFKMIGNTDVVFEKLIETGGVLKGMAEEIDQSKVSTQILSDENKAEYIELHLNVLKSQANAFYSRIVTSIDPLATIDFEYAQSN